MRNLIMIIGAALALGAGAAQAHTVLDPTGDFLPTYTGPRDADLDVTSFTVDYDPTTQNFMLSATFAGTIDPSENNVYVIGADTGTGTIHPFAALGEPNVVFNQVITLAQTGVATIAGHPSLTASISGNAFSLIVPLADLPTTGATPVNYGFNLWPETATRAISDFAPQNANLSAVPEPAAWAMMIAGLAMIGGLLRSRRQTGSALAL
jgi:hypothetical protein